MGKIREYVAILDNGHEYGAELKYYSEHRNGSKQNKRDAEIEMHRRGWRNYIIVDTYKF